MMMYWMCDGPSMTWVYGLMHSQVGHAVIDVEGRKGADKLLVLLELYRILRVRTAACCLDTSRELY